MKNRILLIIIALLFLSVVSVSGQGTYSPKQVSDDLHNNYYNKTAVNTTIENSLLNYYTKVAVDAAINAALAPYALTTALNNYYTKTATDALLDDKASTASVALKANAADVNTTAEVTALLADKADTASVAVKADKTYVDTTDEVLAASVAVKANSADVYTTAAVDLLLTDKSDTAAVAVKADKTYVDGSDEVFLAHTNATSGAHAATAISTTNWTNVQTCIDSIENAINGIITGSGFATMAWVNATVEAALSSAGWKAIEDVGTYISDNKTWEFSTNYDTSCVVIYRNRLLQPRSLFTSSVVSNKTRVTYNSVIDASDEIILISNK